VKTPIRVLIAEDSPVDAELILRELRRAGYDPAWMRVDTEPDYLAQLHPDLDIILSDFEMPQFSGLRAMSLLKESGLDVPLIVISGTIGEEQAVATMKLGGADYLLKDRLSRLGQAVAGALMQRLAQRRQIDAELALRENASFIDDILNSLTAEVVVLNNHGEITAANAAWKRFSRENERGDFLGQNYLEPCARSVQRFDDAHAESARQGIRSVLDGTLPTFTTEYTCDLPTQSRWFRMRVSPLRGAKRGVVIAHEEITDRKQAEADFREMDREKKAAFESNRLKSEFLANMSHELRTPLNAIIGFTEMIQDGRPGPLTEKQKEYLGDVHNGAQHLLQLINDILDLAKVEAGKINLNPQIFSPVQAVEDVRAVVYGLASKGRVLLRCAISPELGPLELDLPKFKQICYNLLSNAIKFTDPGGSVNVDLYPLDGDRFEIRVADTGIGIRPEDLPRLFREFEQLEGGIARRFEGTGLGLALTKKLVEAQWGTIRVESEYGVGSAFTVNLPVASPPNDSGPMKMRAFPHDDCRDL